MQHEMASYAVRDGISCGKGNCHTGANTICLHMSLSSLALLAPLPEYKNGCSPTQTAFNRLCGLHPFPNSSHGNALAKSMPGNPAVTLTDVTKKS